MLVKMEDDGDGVEDEADLYPNDANESADFDGVECDDDDCGLNSWRYEPCDGDGIGNNADADDDGDGIDDTIDNCQFTPNPEIDGD